MVVGPCIKVNPIEGHTLDADRNGREGRADFPIEAILVHAKVSRRISQPNETRHESVCNEVSAAAQAVVPRIRKVEIAVLRRRAGSRVAIDLGAGRASTRWRSAARGSVKNQS